MIDGQLIHGLIPVSSKNSALLTGNEMIQFVRSLWEFHVNNIFTPRSSSYELLITCLAAMNAPFPIFAEFGPYTGHTSFYLTSIASKLGGKSILIDDYSQFSFKGIDIPSDRAEAILKANVGFIPDNRFVILNKDVLVDRNIGIIPGLIYYDICYSSKSAEIIHEIVMEGDQNDSPMMIIIGDVVQKHQSNEDFYNKWVQLWSSTTRTRMTPFFVTGNRLFLANYVIDDAFFSSITAMESFNYVSTDKMIVDSYNWKTVYSSKFNFQKTTKSYEFVNDDKFWSVLEEIFSSKTF